tara:strand:- start:336 stop:512 length:177 start_codon:yes stop_codon:yes gene_type:complete
MFTPFVAVNSLILFCGTISKNFLYKEAIVYKINSVIKKLFLTKKYLEFLSHINKNVEL